MFQKIWRAIPAPKFLDIPFSGLSITDTHIRCLQFGKNSDGLHIEKYKEIPLKNGLITSGQVNNKEELIKILKDLKDELQLTWVKASVPEEKAYLFTARIPIVLPNEVQSVVESRIEGNVPVSPRELIFDYKLIDHRSQGHLDAIVSALPNAFIDSYISFLENAGLRVLSLEIESQAIATALLPEQSNGTVLIVNFGHEKVSLNVVSLRIVRFTSTIPLKGELSEDPTYLSQEIKKLYMYWHTLKENAGKPEKKINQIIVCGENFKQDVVSYIASHNQTETVLGNIWTNAFEIEAKLPDISFEESLRYASAVGLALPTEILI